MGHRFRRLGRDTINVSNATQVVCLPLSSAEQLEAAQNPALLDEEDTFNFDNAKSCAALGGDGADVYNLSGDCNTTTLDGGNGGDVVNAGRLTNFRDGYVTLGNGLNKISGATGDWSNTFIRGGPNADQIDLRLASADVTDTDGVGGARIQTEGGNDVIYGTTGNDYISPGEGADTVFAGSGNDAVQLIDGWKDIADGGQGHDIVEVDWDNFWHQPAESRLTNFEVTSAGNA